MNTYKAMNLEGNRLRLLPLSEEHTQSFKELLSLEKLHNIWYTAIPSPEEVEEEIDRRLGLKLIGSMIPFSVWDIQRNCLCGMTSYMHIDSKHKRLEIGSTWLSTYSQRSGLNTQMKYLMLEHAFQEFECIAVEFRTHIMNTQSRRAIERLGAKLDGILRSHQIMRDGSLRDTCVYSVTRAEWPSVKSNLHYLLTKQY